MGPARTMPAAAAAVLLLLAHIATARADSSSVLARHTLDGGATYTDAGSVDLAEGIFERAPLKPAQLDALAKLVRRGGRYHITLAPGRPGQPDVTASAPAACAAAALLQAGGEGLAVALDASQERIVGVRLPGGGAGCSADAALAALEAAGRGGGQRAPLMQGVRLLVPESAPDVPRMAVAAEQQLPGAAAVAAAQQQRLQQQQQQQQQQRRQRADGEAAAKGSEGEGGEKKPPPVDDRPWWQKNMVFVMAFGMMAVNLLLQNAAPPPPRRGAGAAAGAGGAAVAQR